jgi:uncharacterized protein (TIGR02996 family)
MVPVTHDEAFVQAIIESPDDDGPRLVYADWLEDRGDPLAPSVRARPEIFRILASLKTATEAPFDRIDDHATAGRMDVVIAVARLLVRCQHLLVNPYQPSLPEWTMDHLENVLALSPGAASVEALLFVLASQPKRPPDYRMHASRLASGQPQEVLQRSLERHADEHAFVELCACLVQEMVIRGARLDGLPVVEHPLAALPLRLTAVEAGLADFLPHSSLRGHIRGGATGPSSLPLTVPLPLLGPRPPPALSEVTNEPLSERIGVVVRNWRVETRVFRATWPLQVGDLSLSLLERLGLDCLQGVAGADIRAEFVPASQAVSTLFGVAANGGCYSRGRYGAYGRLEAWSSVAGLVGAPPGETIEDVADMARRCLWVSFTAASEWFYQDTWDLGILCVRPDGMSLAVLAATDTD